MHAISPLTPDRITHVLAKTAQYMPDLSHACPMVVLINQSVVFLTWPQQQTAPQNNRIAIRMEVFGEWLAAFIRQYRVQRG